MVSVNVVKHEYEIERKMYTRYKERSKTLFMCTYQILIIAVAVRSLDVKQMQHLPNMFSRTVVSAVIFASHSLSLL